MGIVRPYDAAFPDDGLHSISKVRERRSHPTGELREIRTVVRGDEIINIYPWSKMELGDFFIAPIDTRSEQAMRVSFSKAAARHDFELIVTRVQHNGVRCLRACVTVIGLRQWKKNAQLRHGAKNIRFHDKTHAANKRKNREKKSGPKVIRALPAFHPADISSPLPDAQPSPEPEVTLTREQIIAKALASKS